MPTSIKRQLDEANRQLAQANAKIKKLEKQNNDMNWAITPDRSGGAFTDQEIQDSREWK